MIRYPPISRRYPEVPLLLPLYGTQERTWNKANVGIPVGSGLASAARTQDGEGGTAALLGWTEGLWRGVVVVQLHWWSAMAVVLAKDKEAKGERGKESWRGK